MKAKRGIPFAEFESVISKLRHAFTALREGRGLLSLCNWIIQRRPQVVYLHRDGALMEALQDTRTILRDSMISPTQCKDLVTAWPDYIGIVDASSHGSGESYLGNFRNSRQWYSVFNGHRKYQLTLCPSQTQKAGSQTPTWRWPDSSSCGYA